METLTLSQEELVKPKVITSDSEEAQKLFNLLASAPDLSGSEEGMVLPPILPDTDDEAVRHYLRRRPFTNTTPLNGNPVDLIITAAKNDEPIQVPVRLIADADGFLSWEGRNAQKTRSTNTGYVTEPSYNVIKHYAMLPTEAPPIKEMKVYIQPDGKIFFRNIGDGSHRLAAAILKGNSTVPTYSLEVHYLDKPFI